MRTREFINKHCKYCKDFEPGLGCGVQWADEVCSDAICEPSYKGKDMVDRIGKYFDKLEEKKNPPSPKKKKVSEKKPVIFLTEAQLGNHARFPMPEFAFVIYVYDEDNDTNLVEIDSVWTNETEALQRMMNLEKMENAILERSDCVKYSYRYKLRGYSDKFPFADGTNIMRENPDGTVHDWKYGIVCKRVPLNVKTLLKPFNIDEYKTLVNKVKGKDK